jgi:hypothetical protein
MTPTHPSRLNKPLRGAFTTPAAIAREDADKTEAEEAISCYWLEHNSIVYLDRADADDSARMAASARPDQQEWEDLVGLAAPYGGNLRDAQRLARGEEPLGFQLPPPPSFSYVIEIEFDESVRIEATEERTKLAQREFSEKQPEWDLLWLPDGISTGACLRVVTHRDLRGHFDYMGSYRVFGQPRRPAS